MTKAKRLIMGRKRAGGRSWGKVTSRHKGGGAKRLYRMIDFMRDKHEISARVEAVEYDPNRSASLARLLYADGERRYILLPDGLKVGEKVLSGENAPVKIGK